MSDNQELFNPFDTTPFLTQINEKTGKSVVIPNAENVIRALEILPETTNVFRLNKWTGRKETIFKSKEWRTVEDFDLLLVRKELVNSFPFMAIQMVKKGDIDDAITYLCNINVYDPVIEYLKKLKWDKVPRIENLTKVLGAEDTPVNKLFITSWILGMTRRLVEAGSKYDYVLVLEGEQGIGKSFFFHNLTDIFNKGDDNLNHLETTISPDSKDFYMQMMGKIVVEFTEGEIFSKASQEMIKGVITKRVDSFRPPFAKEVIDVPRRFVFAMTTNSDNYLKDDSGGRRWLPIACGKIDIDYVRENRDQIYAEAYHRLYILKEPLPNVETKEAKDAQKKRKINSVNEEYILNWYMGLSDEERFEGVSLKGAFDTCIAPNNSFEKFDRRLEMFMGNVFRNILKLEKKQIHNNGQRLTSYFPSKKTEDIIKKMRSEDEITIC